MIDNILVIAVVLLLGVGTLGIFAVVDKPRKPLTRGAAAVCLVFNITIIYLLLKAYI